MTSWRDQLGSITLPDGRELVAGSFRGVPFRTVGAELRVGRRNVVNEFPQRNEAYVDDLGARARRFVVEAYVQGDNYFQERQDLVDAFEAPGPGELIHPRYGVRQVALDGEVSIKETPAEGGIARISATFVEHGENIFLRPLGNTLSKLESASNAADDAAQAVFADEFSVAGPSVLATQALKKLNSVVAGALATARQVASVDGLVNVVQQAVFLSDNLASLVRTPVNVAMGLRSLYASLVQDVQRPVNAFYELQWVFTGARRTAAVDSGTSTYARSLANDMASADLQRRLALSNQARLLAVAVGDGSVTTADQAVSMRNALLAQIDTELETYDPPREVATALTAMRATVVRDVAARAEYLMQRSSYTPRTVLPAVVLAHRIYQDATRADELVSRNDVRHPAFMPARPLEILV